MSPSEEQSGYPSLDNERSQTTSGLWDFGKSTLLRVRSTKDRKPCFDQVTIGPLCFDSTDGICSSPMCFLCSLDIDLMVQAPLHN
jgi:hypothetical protein